MHNLPTGPFGPSLRDADPDLLLLEAIHDEIQGGLKSTSPTSFLHRAQKLLTCSSLEFQTGFFEGAFSIPARSYSDEQAKGVLEYIREHVPSLRDCLLADDIPGHQIPSHREAFSAFHQILTDSTADEEMEKDRRLALESALELRIYTDILTGDPSLAVVLLATHHRLSPWFQVLEDENASPHEIKVALGNMGYLRALNLLSGDQIKDLQEKARARVPAIMRLAALASQKASSAQSKSS